MDKLLGVDHVSKSSKNSRSKKKAVKFVYISNPLKVNASASDFRALVQKLTGRDSNDQVHGNYYSDHTGVAEEDPPFVGHPKKVAGEEKEGPGSTFPVPAGAEDHSLNKELDDVFMPKMEENCSSFCSCSIFYEYHMGGIKNLFNAI